MEDWFKTYRKLIKVICKAYRLKEKEIMVISIDAKKAFNDLQPMT